MNNSIKRNFLYNIILTFSSYIFPLLTFPYINRVLGVANIGICDYIDSIIQYFIILSSLGTQSIGLREIAKFKDSPAKLRQQFSSIIFINAVLTVVAVIILVCCTFMLSKLVPYRAFLLIGVFKLFFSCFLIEWLFQGLSNFEYITKRTLVIKIIYVISIFVFIKEQSDTVKYYFLTTAIIVVNAFLNWIYSRQIVVFSFSALKIKPLLVPVLSYGVYKILTSFYTTFNVFYLGNVSTTTEVGYFTTATKLYGIIMVVFGALTGVLVPHISKLISEGNRDALLSISRDIFVLIFLLSPPIIILCDYNSSLIIDIIAGHGFEKAKIPFMLVMILVFITALEQVVIQQFLMASNSSKCVLSLSITGAIVGVSMNCYLTPIYAAIGSAISWIFSETAVLVVGLFFFKRSLNLEFPYRKMLLYVFLSLPYLLICIFFHSDRIISLGTQCLLALVWFIFVSFKIQPNNIIRKQVVELFHKYK